MVDLLRHFLAIEVEQLDGLLERIKHFIRRGNPLPDAVEMLHDTSQDLELAWLDLHAHPSIGLFDKVR